MIARSCLSIIAVALIVTACAPAAPAPIATARAAAPASPSATAASGLAAIRARGSMVVSIRVEAPPSGRTSQDPAHSQKRALEAAVATLVAKKVFGANVRVEFRGQGGDRLGPVERGEADLAMTTVRIEPSQRVLLSTGYTGAAIVLAAPPSAGIAALTELRGKTIAVAMDELGAPAIAQAALRAQGIDATLQTVTGVLGAADAVAAGRAAALIGDRVGIAVLLKERPGTLRIVTELEPLAYVIAVPRSAPDLLAVVNDALRELTDSGEIRKAADEAGFPYAAPFRP